MAAREQERRGHDLEAAEAITNTAFLGLEAVKREKGVAAWAYALGRNIAFYRDLARNNWPSREGFSRMVAQALQTRADEFAPDSEIGKAIKRGKRYEQRRGISYAKRNLDKD